MKNQAKLLMLASFAAHRSAGEAVLSNLYGAGDDDFDGPSSATQYVDQSTRKSMGIGTIDSTARLIGISVVNNSATETKRVVLFGGYANSTAVNNGNAPVTGAGTGVSVTSDTVPYAQLLEQTKSNPMLFQGLRLVAGGQSPSAQLTNIIRLKHSDATGREESQPYNPSTRLSTMQNIANIIEDASFTFLAAGDSSIEFDLLPGTTIKLILSLKAQTDLGRVLNGKSALEVSNAPSQMSPQLVLAQPSNFTGRY